MRRRRRPCSRSPGTPGEGKTRRCDFPTSRLSHTDVTSTPMAQSFLAAAPGALSCSTPNKRRTVLVTGAAGHIGSYFAEHCHDRYELRLMVRGDEDKAKLDAIRKFGAIVTADLSELDKLKEHFRGV